MTEPSNSPPDVKRLIVFARCPEPGHCKTRLIPALGKKGALALHEVLVRQTMSWMGNAIDEGVAVEVRYSGDCLEKLRILCGDSVDRVGFRPQKGEDLGQRLAEASATAFQEGSSRVAIIGTDCPQLDSSIALKTFLLLDKCDVVLGPAADGGYYLIATRKLVPQLFERIPWGGPTVLRDTLSRALGLDLTVELLPTLTDVDRIEDIHLIGPEYITNCG